MAVMARYGLADEVTDELRSIDAPMTISTIQNFYYSQLVLQFMDRVGISRPADFLEIGGETPRIVPLPNGRRFKLYASRFY